MNPPPESQFGAAGSRTQELYREPTSPAPAPLQQPPPPVRSVLDAVIDATVPTTSSRSTLLQTFLAEDSDWEALILWLGKSNLRQKKTQQQIARMLNRDIGIIDRILNAQVNAVIHHPRFQKLEASWRGLHYLVEQVEEGEEIKVKVLNLSWKEMARDLERAIEFDQSQLFRKVYSDEFGSPGGEPFGVLLGDYEIRHRRSQEHQVDDLEILSRINQVAAASFAPFIAAADPSLFGMDSFPELEHSLNLSRAFDQTEYVKWKSLRKTEDSRFAALVLPHTLMRLPYRDDGSRSDGFRFQEDVEKPDRSQYLWGNACYAFGGVLVRAFAESGWLAGINGVQKGIEGGGLATGLPVHTFPTDSAGVAYKSSTDAVITDQQDKELSDLGFLPLCQCADSEHAAFYTTHSMQKPKKYDELPATMNARISAMLQYMLSVSRFAHYLKVIARDKIGTFTTADECEEALNNWLQKYVTANAEAGMETKAKHPLQESRVQIREHPEKPGSFLCVAHLRPHFQLDEMVSSIRLATELGPAQSD